MTYARPIDLPPAFKEAASAMIQKTPTLEGEIEAFGLSGLDPSEYKDYLVRRIQTVLTSATYGVEFEKTEKQIELGLRALAKLGGLPENIRISMINARSGFNRIEWCFERNFNSFVNDLYQSQCGMAEEDILDNREKAISTFHDRHPHALWKLSIEENPLRNFVNDIDWGNISKPAPMS